MTTVIKRDDVPSHLFNIPELDFSEDLFAEPLGGPWFRLGAWTIQGTRDERGTETEVSRQSFLLAPESFCDVFDKLESIGNVTRNLGKPHGWVLNEGKQKQYTYTPFHEFEFPFSSVVGEPLVFVRFPTSGVELFINPDLWLFFELEEKPCNGGVWWDERRGVEAIRRRLIEHDSLAIVEIRVNYLVKYLQARQLSLVVAHYRHLHLFNPSPNAVERFVKEDVTLGSPEQQAKAILQNWGLRNHAAPFLQRRLHLWFQILPPAIDVEDPWTDEPPFDPYVFTLPTRDGLVAPARWAHFKERDGCKFEGEVCDFMDRVYFRQEVLTKYEGASGFDIADDGSVSCRYYWGLVRSTSRLGNELVATAIGDFAEGIPLEEWPHWKQYAVDPPSTETAAALREEQTVPEAVNSVIDALEKLNSAFGRMASSLQLDVSTSLWQGSLDSLAARQLKWVYPASADDDEFLKRATLASTLIVDGLIPRSMRQLLVALGSDLHLNDEEPPRPLGSRNLLQRLTLVAVLIADLRPQTEAIPTLLKMAERRAGKSFEPDLQTELTMLQRRVRDEFAPLAFLYDLRTHGGLAHPPNKERASKAAVQLGLPKSDWRRVEYLRLLNTVADSILQIRNDFDAAELVLAGE